jgi:hypothetical protein
MSYSSERTARIEPRNTNTATSSAGMSASAAYSRVPSIIASRIAPANASHAKSRVAIAATSPIARMTIAVITFQRRRAA